MIDPVLLIPKTTWGAVTMSGDVGINGGYPLTNVWDGNTTNFMHTDDPATLPALFTWDLGLKAKLKKMKHWTRNSNADRWTRGSARVFEINGSLTRYQDGSQDTTWTLWGQLEYEQPSDNGMKTPW